MLRQLLQGLSAIHQYNIIHRDIKPDNILMTEARELRFADFGMARELAQDEEMTNQVSTLYYRAPQLIMGDRHYTKAVDTWGAGCIFYELLKRTILFQGKTEAEILLKMFSLLGPSSPNNNGPFHIPIPKNLMAKGGLPTVSSPGGLASLKIDEQLRKKSFEGIPEKALDLLLKLLCLDPRARISPEDALKHSYLKETEELN